MRVAVADDITLFREAFSLLLEEMGFEVIAQAGDGNGIIEAVADDRPDVVILDIAMPPGDYGGLEAAERLRKEHPTMGLLLLSAYGSTRFALRLPTSETGGTGYLIKDHVEDRDVLEDAIRRVAAGKNVVDSEIVTRLVDRHRNRHTFEALTKRQAEVLELVARGLSNKGIAKELRLERKTVDRHVSDILDKLNIAAGQTINRRSLMVLAYFHASHICDSRCTKPCSFISSSL